MERYGDSILLNVGMINQGLILRTGFKTSSDPIESFETGSINRGPFYDISKSFAKQTSKI